MTFGDIVRMVKENPELVDKEINLVEHNADWHYDDDNHRRICDTLEIDDQFNPMPGERFGLSKNDIVLFAWHIGLRHKTLCKW